LFDQEFIKWLATLGVGGALAAFMFMYYRKDMKQYTELWKLMADELVTIVKENTTSNQKLISLIESQERNQVRMTDLERLFGLNCPLATNIKVRDEKGESNKGGKEHKT